MSCRGGEDGQGKVGSGEKVIIPIGRDLEMESRKSGICLLGGKDEWMGMDTYRCGIYNLYLY